MLKDRNNKYVIHSRVGANITTLLTGLALEVFKGLLLDTRKEKLCIDIVNIYNLFVIK